MVLASGLIAFMSMPMQHDAVERADRRAFAGEGEAVADRHPEDRAERDRGQRLRHGGEHVLLAHHAGVEQRQARDAHHQHQAGRRNHPGGVGGIDLGWLRRGLRESRRRRQCHQHGNGTPRACARKHSSDHRLPPEFGFFRARRCRSRRCGCARRDRGRRQRFFRRRSGRSWPRCRSRRRPCRRCRPRRRPRS